MKPGSIVARALGLAFAVLAATLARGLVMSWGEPRLRSIARGVAIVLLAEMAAMAWSWPKRRPRRIRERIARFLAIAADSSRHVDYAETTPQVALPVALLDDLDALREDARELGADERAIVETLAADVEPLRPELASLAATPASELPGRPAWQAFVAACDRARTAWKVAHPEPVLPGDPTARVR